MTELAEAMVRLTHLVRRVFAEVSRDHDLTPQQTHLLCVLAPAPLGMTELGRSLHLEKSSLTGFVDRVERRGLVARTRDAHDRRVCHVALTDEGARLAHKAHAEICARLEALATALPEEDRHHFAASIEQISPR
jgi:DNA-binding MarR family transcriptional regulator